jgi:hypothetical protein
MNGKKETTKHQTTIEILDRLHDSGDLERLVKSGLLSWNVILWRKIYHAYHLRLTQIESRTQAVTDVSEVFKVSDRMIYRIVERLRK